MYPVRMPRTPAHLFLATSLLAACASTPQRTASKDLRLDTETVGRMRYAASVGKGAGSFGPVVTSAATHRLSDLAPVLLTLLESDNTLGEFEERLVECARQSERQVNASFFGNRAPTREECGEEVEVDGCGAPTTRAMLLGQKKHALALQCAREVLEQLWPASFSLEQRYRYYPNAQFVETVSREEEARLIAQGCTRELWRTIKPDIVLHGDHDPRRSALTLDFKYPCPDTNEPRWTRYGENSAYAGSNQGRVYRDALGGEALMISPRTGVTR
ncbi:hypothetical protein SAMN05443639_101573 [Stigmatella erecta]|uniref:Lipoprotein n=1 Tax=Stigmatella erecta TaxID=83460 RepID=A0A1I0A829_9BACT|nr:hypothetical protein SAMN05443639_101573 [Stigmatella erecta]